jgi:hypothetical protein
MGIGNNFDQFMHAIQSDTAEWSVINDLKEGETFAVLVDFARGEETIVPLVKKSTSEAVADTFKKTIPSKIPSSDEKNLKWLAEKNLKTMQHVRGLIQNLDVSDPAILKKSLNALGKLKQQMNDAANNGYNHLKITYRGQATSEGKPVADVLLQEQRKICDRAISEIDKAIVDLGTKLSAKQKEPLKAEDETAKRVQALRSNSIIGRAFDSLSRSMPKSAPQEEVPAIASLVDPTANKQWETVMQSGKWKQFFSPMKEDEQSWKKLELQLKEPALVVGTFLVDELKRSKDSGVQPLLLKDAQGNDVKVPLQFGKDLHRTSYLNVNGRLAYSKSRTFEHTEGDAFHKLTAACEKKVGIEKAELLAYRVASIINQGLSADLAGRVMVIHSPDIDHRLDVRGSGLIWSIDVKDDKIVIQLKVSITLRDPDADDPNIGAVLAKRVI